MITIILGNTKAKIVGLREPEIAKELDQKLSYFIQGYQFMNVHNNWDGRHRLLDRHHQFPIGLLSTVERIFRSRQIIYKVQDNRDALNYGTPLILSPTSGFKPRDYQEEIIEKAWDRGSGVIRVATGGGKSLIIAMLAARFNVKAVIYVIGIELLYQMKNTLERAYPTIKVGMVGDGICDIQPITIATIWSAASAFDFKPELLENDLTPDSKKSITAQNKEDIREMVKSAELFILDECQYAASETVKFLHRNSLAARHRFLLSGTPWRESGDDLLIEAVGGPKIYDLSASQLIDRGWLVQPKIHFLNVPEKRGLGKVYQEIYKNYVVSNPDRNDLIIKATKRLIERGRKVLILVSQVQHGKFLLSALENDLKICSLDGKNKTADRLRAIEMMRHGELDAMIASRIFDQGIDIVELDALVLASAGKSSGRALQRIGRVIRTGPQNKRDAIVVDFFDNCKYLKEHTLARQRIYATEPRFEIKLPGK